MNKEEAINQLIKSFEQWKQVSTRHYQQEVKPTQYSF